ncbi:protein-disulfide reductase [Edwardsiella hoshinae]|uniref:Protein-disulfide reductase n=1 Tax=Edwardsiella hoshinae TaxID=93378 RepID=A0ABM6EHH3_9GAMM|nr:thioredoxin family protein [Edwardsiella hoshinae]AOV96377.1 protein-disulfide reductase [Edwardsiella hoshinae]
MSLIFRALAIGLCLWLPLGWAADSGWLLGDSNGQARVRFSAARQDAQRVDLVVQVALASGWKTYWRAPGEGGVAPSIAWRTPSLAVHWRWPVPQRFSVAGLTAQGYVNDVSFPIQVNTTATRLQGVLTLPLCSDVCVLHDYPFDLDLLSAPTAEFRHTLAQAEGTLPLDHGMVDRVSAGYERGNLTLRIDRAGGWQHPAIFLAGPEGAAFAAPQLWQQAETLYARVAVSDGWQGSAPDLRAVPLTLVISDVGVAQQMTVSADVASVAPPGPPAGSATLLGALLLALAGGLILNLMPCVLPVLALKLGSVLHAPLVTARQLRHQFLLSAAGIIASFALLAGLMSVLRLTQQAVGWGIQFQSPWFIGVMGAITLLFALNLFGFFSLTLSSALMTRLAGASQGHFWQGMFATLLATPCSAPFMGTALAFALAAPLPQLWLVFLALGVGMSAPWLAIAAWPHLATWLPRPGRWMLHLRTILGVMMLASSLWLLSLLAAHLGWPVIVASMTLLALLLLGLSWRRYALRGLGWALLTTLLLSAIPLLMYGESALTPQQDRVDWQPLSEQAVQQALQQRKRVFIDVTADWCVTCKANKVNVLLRDEVQQALRADDVVALRGDWTLPSPALEAFMRQRGAVAVPFNQIYGPALPQGAVLPPLLDRRQLLAQLAAAKE